MNNYSERFIEQAIKEKIRYEKGDNNLDFEFSLTGTKSLLYDWRGRAYLSCYNEEKSTFFDAIVEWEEKENEVELKIKYEDKMKKEELGIYHWM